MEVPRLPPELWNEILKNTDVKTCVAFRNLWALKQVEQDLDQKVVDTEKGQAFLEAVRAEDLCVLNFLINIVNYEPWKDAR